MKIRNTPVNLGISELHPHPHNPRKELGDLSELTESIRTAGSVYQNLAVIPGHYKGDELVEGGYTIIIGHRRCAAAKAAGLTRLPCKVIEGSTLNEQIAMMLEENIQRNDLTVYEQAQSFQLMLDLGETEDSIADKTGFSRQTVRHRLELAKLDKDIFKQKTGDEGFQMTLKDMYVLEQIEDVDARNEVLSSAENSSQLAWKAANKLREIECKKNKKLLIAMLVERGVTEVPKSYEREQYTGKWERIKEYQLDCDLPKRIKLEKSDEPYYYYATDRYVSIVRKVKKVKGEPTECEIQQKKMKAANNELATIKGRLDGDIREFIIGIADGRYTIPKSYEAQVMKEVWGIMTSLNYCGVGMESMINYLTGKYTYEMTLDEKDGCRERVEKLTMLRQMIVCVGRGLNRDCKLVGYPCSYKEKEGKCYQSVVNLLEGYGFTLDEDERQLVDGTHVLYGEE
nr:MAG TPA: chromosome partitioning protein [Caudoviricetes sp.]